MKRKCLIAAGLIILMTGCTPAIAHTPTPPAATAASGTIYIDPGRDLGPISPYIFGENYNMSAGLPAGKLQYILNSKISTMRFPGGSWGDQNDLSNFSVQIDLFMNICKQMGAMPTVSVRLLGGTPQQAADLVRYFNIDQKYGITYWSIGNEPDLYASLPHVTYDTTRFNQEWRAIALAMKAVDPKIKLMGPELSQWGTDINRTPKYPRLSTPSAVQRQDWMTDFLKANGDLVDIVTVHRYPIYAPASPTPITVENLRQNTLEWETMVTYLRGLVKQTTGRDLPVAFTEVNSDPSPVLGGIATPDSFYNAIWYADVLGHLITQNVFMVNHWALANSGGGLGLLTINEIRPTYYVFQMYSHYGNEQVYSASGTKFVDVYASKRSDGTLTIMVVNLTDNTAHIPMQIKGAKLKNAEIWLFDSSHNAVDLGVKSFSTDGMVDLTPQSITLYVINH